LTLAIDTAYDPTVGLVEVAPQEIGRVFLNVLNNACYAGHEKRQALGESFTPTLTVRTIDRGDRVEIRIRDNGNGIPPEVRGHHGEIAVDTEVGQYAEFIITRETPEAYERLLLDCLRGDPTLFARGDWVEAAWALVMPILAAWQDGQLPRFPNYAAGTWGPPEAEEFMGRDGRRWRQL